MKKTILALAILGTTVGIAHAQSSVTLYGYLDTGLIKESGTSTRMGLGQSSGIGFRGQEDLGGGLKATFQLEQRLNLNDGTSVSGGNTHTPFQNGDRNMYDILHGKNTVQLLGGANIGLAGSFGAVRFGRVGEFSTETYSAVDPFVQATIGSSFFTPLRSENLSNTVRYDSPTFKGFTGGLSYTLKADDNDTSVLADPEHRNAGYAVSLKYDNSPVYLVGNYSRLADSGNSNNWNIGGAYSLGNIKVSLGYQHTKLDAGILTAATGNAKQKDWLAGVQWKLGAGTLKASYNRATLDNPIADGKVQKYALGYTYDLSRRTAIYDVVAYIRSDNDNVGFLYNGNGAFDDSVTGYQVGLNHRF